MAVSAWVYTNAVTPAGVGGGPQALTLPLITSISSLSVPTVALYSFPYPVLGLTATPISASQIDLLWSSLSGASSYDVERDSVVIALSVVGTSYSDTDAALLPSTSYDYRVRGVS